MGTEISDPAEKPSLKIPAYDHALYKLMSDVIDGLIGVDPILGQIGYRATGHAGPTRNAPAPNPVDHSLSHFEETILIHADTIRSTDIDGFICALTELAQKYEDAMGRTLVQTLHDVTNATGGAIDAKGKPFTWDLFLDMLEAMDFTFDDEGRPHAKQVIMNPETAKILQATEITPEQRQRHDRIMIQKKEQWDAQKRYRRLPRQRARA